MLGSFAYGRLPRAGILPLVLALISGCGSDKSDDTNKSSGGSGGSSSNNNKAGSTSKGGSSPVMPTGDSSAADIARKLGRDASFLIGMGNDLPKDYIWEKAPVYSFGPTLDLHYVYLTKGWQDWNAGGTFAKVIGDVDKGKGVTPMATYYGMAGQGENNFNVLTDDAYMNDYWTAAKLLMQHYAELGVPAVVHLEPDFWAFAQRKAPDPTTIPAHLHPDCKNLPDDLTGMARCWFKLARDNAPKVIIGLHASEWGGDGGGSDVGGYLNKLGAAESDIVVIDMLDRDAGCFEDGKLPQCMRGGTFYLDETNKTSPNFSERLKFAKDVSTTTGKPILWWQLPFGVPSDKPGGTPGHFRDNKVHYLFSHVQEFVDAGGVGASFGTGADGQTFVDTDNGQFKDAVNAYYKAPVALP